MTNATEWSAIVIQRDGSEIIQVAVHERWRLEVRVNGEQQDFDDMSQQTFSGMFFSIIY